MGVRTANVQPGNIGETLTGLAEVIHGRRDAPPQESYTARLLTDVEDELLKKLAEEASEVISSRAPFLDELIQELLRKQVAATQLPVGIELELEPRRLDHGLVTVHRL